MAASLLIHVYIYIYIYIYISAFDNVFFPHFVGSFSHTILQAAGIATFSIRLIKIRKYKNAAVEQAHGRGAQLPVRPAAEALDLYNIIEYNRI